MKPHQQRREAAGGVAIVGPGRLGHALGRLLVDAGVPVRWIVARRLQAARRAARFIGSGRAIGPTDARLAEAVVILLTTADAAVAPVARNLAQLRRDWTGKVVLHTCGALPSSVLNPLRQRGAAIGSLHPFQTIPTPQAGVRNLRGCYWGIEGEPAARRVAQKWVKALEGRLFLVRPSQKTLYHAAAFLVCPTVVTLMENSVRLLRRAGVPEKIARPMLGGFVAETVRNFVNLGGRRALTGPAVRGDWATIQRHLAALRRSFPDLVPVYLELVHAMVRLAGRRVPQLGSDRKIPHR